MNNILVFAGTTEGRILCEYLCSQKIFVTACVATQYGETVINKNEFLNVCVGRMDQQQMIEKIRQDNYSIVIDATHPYAVEVTDNIQAACKVCSIDYIRLLRHSSDTQNVIYVDSVEQGVAFLNTNSKKALITTGSKELKVFTKVNDYTSRLTVRVLPSVEVIEQCNTLGFRGQHLIAMQGPFSEMLNYATLKQINAQYLVTKESGDFGGFIEKINAAKKAGAEVIVIKRPKKEQGFSLEEIKEMLSRFK
jgi:precorrin-6x reductase